MQGTRLGLLKTCPHSGLVWADAVCALCTQATCTGTTKRSLSDVRRLSLTAEYVSSHLLSSVHLGLMKADLRKNAHSTNSSQCSTLHTAFPPRALLHGSHPSAPSRGSRGAVSCLSKMHRSLAGETLCHKIHHKRLYKELKRCTSSQRRRGANYSLLETRENHL